MKVQPLNPSRFLVVLSREESQVLGLSREGASQWQSLHCRLAAARIFSQISRKYRVPVAGRTILLRAYPAGSGETILLFTICPKKRLRLRAVSQHHALLYEFSRAEDLFRAASALRGRFPGLSSRLYRWPSPPQADRWRLCVSARLHEVPALRCILGEYARFTGGGQLAACSACEYGILLSDCALETLTQ